MEGLRQAYRQPLVWILSILVVFLAVPQTVGSWDVAWKELNRPLVWVLLLLLVAAIIEAIRARSAVRPDASVQPGAPDSGGIAHCRRAACADRSQSAP
jgi:hypothetical protein